MDLKVKKNVKGNIFELNQRNYQPMRFQFMYSVYKRITCMKKIYTYRF